MSATVDPVASQMEALTAADVPESRFFPGFLQVVVQLLEADGALLWSQGPTGRLELAFGIHLQHLGYRQQIGADERNRPLLEETLRTGRAQVLAPNGHRPLPTEHVLVLAPLHRGPEILGVAEVFLPAATAAERFPEILQTAEQLCGYASRYLQLRLEAATEQPTELTTHEFSQFALALQRSLDPEAVAAAATNEGRQQIRCDRVTVALNRGRQTRILSISGQEHVNRKANVVRLLEQLAGRVVATGEPLIYAGRLEQLPPQIEGPLADYLQESGTRYVHIEPLFAGGETTPNRPRTAARQKAIGALVVEQFSEGKPRVGIAARTKLVATQTAAALKNALQHRRIFLLPLWQALGTCVEKLRGAWLLRLFLAVSVCAGAGWLLVQTPWEYRVEANGRLLPSIRQQVFASTDGQITDVFVQSGDFVEAGDPLVQLWSEDLQSQLVVARNQRDEFAQLKKALDAELNDALTRGDRTEAIRIQGRIVQTRIQEQDAASRVAILEGQLAELTVRAPIAGVVATFQLAELLSNRPVQRGEALLEVMDVRQGWQLELDVPEHRLGHVLTAQQRAPESELPVEFVLATSSETRHAGRLRELSTRAESGTESPVVRAVAVIGPEELVGLRASLRIGAETRARIACGERSLAYVLFGDFVEFIQRRFW